jgi:hypothetical protein
MSERTAFFGWYGLTLSHPVSWELARVTGSRRTGYVSFDDGERVRLELDWKPVDAKVTLESLCEKQRSALEKTAKRRHVAFESKPLGKVKGVEGWEYDAWAWSADVSAREMLARCRKCGRTVLARVLGPKDKPPEEESELVFGSLVCDCGREYERWGAFGIDARVPVRFELERSSLKAGLCELVFSDKKSEMTILRASLGRMILEKTKLVGWYSGVAAAALKPFDVEWQKDDLCGHLGYSCSAELRSNRRLRWIFRSKRAFAARLFFCEPSDKIYCISADGPDDVAALVKDVADKLVCHSSLLFTSPSGGG